jgi:hypothetical protein
MKVHFNKGFGRSPKNNYHVNLLNFGFGRKEFLLIILGLAITFDWEK